MFKIMGPISFLFTLWLPSGLQLYFIFTFGLGALQTYILRNAAIRHALGLPAWTPPPEASSATPAGSSGMSLKDLIYQAPRGAGAENVVSTTAMVASATGGGATASASAAGEEEKPKHMTERVVKAINESVPWQAPAPAPTAEQKARDARNQKLKDDDEAEKRLEQLQKERRRREFESRFS